MTDASSQDDLRLLLEQKVRLTKLHADLALRLQKDHLGVVKLREKLTAVDKRIEILVDKMNAVGESGRPLDPDSLSGRVRELLDMNQDDIWSAADVSDELGEDHSSVSSTLATLCKRRFIRRVRRGRYSSLKGTHTL